MVAISKLTDADRDVIRARKAADPSISNAALGREYGVDASVISRLVNAKSIDAVPSQQVAAAPSGTIVGAAHNRIHPSPLNPRKRFDPAALEDLSQSVEQKGVLQQLLVRYANQPGNSPIAGAQAGDLEIIAGERRWRAASLVIARGAFPADYAMPIKLVDPCDDLEMLKLALTENTARNDMTPWEEAEAYAQFAAKGISNAEIGKFAGRNARTVQKRLRLVNDLTPKVRSALAEGDLHVEYANVLAAYCPKSKQDATLEEIRRGHHATSQNLKTACLRVTRKTSVAFFDLAKYKGALIEDEDAPGEAYFADLEQFDRLQMAAVDAKVEELSQTYKSVEVQDYKAGHYFSSWDYEKLKSDPEVGAVIEIKHDRSVAIHLDLVKKSRLAARVAAGTGSTPAPPEPVTKGHCIHAHQRKTLAMQEAIAAAPLVAMRLVCAALLGSTEAVKISADEIRDGALSENVKATIARIAAPGSKLKGSKGVTFGHKGAQVFEYDYYTQGQNDHAGLWVHLAALPDEEIAQLFAALVALRSGSFDDYNPFPGDRAAAIAIADTLGLIGREAEHGLSLQPEDLDGVRKDTLLTCAAAAGVEGKMSDMKAKDLARYIRGMVSPQYVFPTLRFGNMAAIRAQLAGKPEPSNSRAQKEAKAATSNMTDAQIDACIIVKTGPSTGISGAEVQMSSGCSYDDIVQLVAAMVLRSDSDNFLTKGMNFPPEIILTARSAQRVKEPPTVESDVDETSEPLWDPDEKLAEIKASLQRDADIFDLNTEEDVRKALIQGINAWRVMPLDTPIEGSKTFDSDDMPFDALGLIIELFDAFPDEDYGEISDLDDAVVVVCYHFDIAPTFVRRPAAEAHP